VSGNDAKLIPNNGKLEVRAKGPNVTPGYWRQPELTAAAFDEEGFYKFGDALKPVDPNDFNAGFDFDGRIAEDFKLSTGTWVSVGPLRTRFILHAAPWVKDVVIAGHNRDDVTALIIPDPDRPADRAVFEKLLRDFACAATGSSNRIARAIVLREPPSLNAGEVTDKGSLNQAAVLRCRAALVEQLYMDPVPDSVIVSEENID
jgi:feruloyl-CoA synthase